MTRCWVKSNSSEALQYLSNAAFLQLRVTNRCHLFSDSFWVFSSIIFNWVDTVESRQSTDLMQSKATRLQAIRGKKLPLPTFQCEKYPVQSEFLLNAINNGIDCNWTDWNISSCCRHKRGCVCLALINRFHSRSAVLTLMSLHLMFRVEVMDTMCLQIECEIDLFRFNVK